MIDISKLKTEDDVLDVVTGLYFGAQGASLINLITAERVRATISRAFSDHYSFGINPEDADLSDNGMAKLIMRGRMMENVSGATSRDEYRGKFPVLVLAEAVMISLEESDHAIERSGEGTKTAMDLGVTGEQRNDAVGEGSSAHTPSLNKVNEIALADLSDSVTDEKKEYSLPVDFLTHLAPGPGAQAPNTEVSAWLRFAPLGDVAFSIAFPDLSEAGIRDLTEVEAEFYGAKNKSWSRVSNVILKTESDKNDAEYALTLRQFKNQVSPASISDDAILQQFRSCVRQAIEATRPDTLKTLEAHGASVRLTDDLVDILKRISRLEEEWLGQVATPLDGDQQNHAGSPTPQRRIDKGMIVTLAVCDHLATGRRLDLAIGRSCEDVRRLIIDRLSNEGAPRDLREFRQILNNDLLRPVSDFETAKNHLDNQPALI